MIGITGNRSGDTTGKSGDTTDRAGFRSFSSASLAETLYDAIRNEWSNNALKVIIKELYNRGYNRDQLIRMVENRFDKHACLKIIRIIFS